MTEPATDSAADFEVAAAVEDQILRGATSSLLLHPNVEEAVSSGSHVRAACALANGGVGGIAVMGATEVRYRAVFGAEFDPRLAAVAARDLETRLAPSPGRVLVGRIWQEYYGGGHALAVLVERPDRPGLHIDRAEGDRPKLWHRSGSGDSIVHDASAATSRLAAEAGLWSTESTVTAIPRRFGAVPAAADVEVVVDGRLTALGVTLHGTRAARAALPGLGVAIAVYPLDRATCAAVGSRPVTSVWMLPPDRLVRRARRLVATWVGERRDADGVVEALVEIIANAVAHRVLPENLVGTPSVDVAVYEDAFVVASDGRPAAIHVAIEDDRFTARFARNPHTHEAVRAALGSTVGGFDRAAKTLASAGLTVSATATAGRTVVTVERRVRVHAMPPAVRARAPGSATEGSAEVRTGALRDRVAAALTDVPRSTSEIAALVGAAASTVRAHLAALVRRGDAMATAGSVTSPGRGYVRAR